MQANRIAHPGHENPVGILDLPKCEFCGTHSGVVSDRNFCSNCEKLLLAQDEARRDIAADFIKATIDTLLMQGIQGFEIRLMVDSRLDELVA